MRLRPMLSLMVLGLVPALLVSATCARAAERKAKDEPTYGQNLISIVTRRHADFPSGTCSIWENAEGLGVGPAELGGLHGLTMSIDLKPMSTDAPKPFTFDQGLADMKKRFPTAPAWMVQALQKNQAAIEAACAQDHETPYVIKKLTAADKRG